MAMRGTIERIWENTREDGSVYWVLTISGQRYSAFDPDLVQEVSPGDMVEFSYTCSGSYKNLLAIRRIPEDGFVIVDHPDETTRIVRMNSLRTAAELLRDSKLGPDQRANAALQVADKLEHHILRPPQFEDKPATQDDEDAEEDA